MAVHHAAADGFTNNADGYVRGRPDYPPALDRWLRDALGPAAGKTVVDLGRGTGKFVPRLRTTGATIVAVEPVDAMRARLASKCPDVTACAGTADGMPLATASVDAVVCAQAFHWFATEAALAEIARVLRPGGALALVWNVRDASVPWMRRATELITPYEGDAPRFAKGDWRRVFPAAGFGPLEETRFPHVHVGPPEQVIVDRFLSVSFIAALPAAERERVAAGLRALIDDDPTLRGKRESRRRTTRSPTGFAATGEACHVAASVSGAYNKHCLVYGRRGRVAAIGNTRGIRQQSVERPLGQQSRLPGRGRRAPDAAGVPGPPVGQRADLDADPDPGPGSRAGLRGAQSGHPAGRPRRPPRGAADDARTPDRFAGRRGPGRATTRSARSARARTST